MRRKIAGMLMVLTLIGLLPIVTGCSTSTHEGMEGMSMEEHQELMLEHKGVLRKELLDGGEYQCCLEEPCDSCLEMDYHGEGPSCHCLTDLVNGEGPCDECAGGILAGRGNPYLEEYFVDSLADKYGEDHRGTIQTIINEQYSVEDEA